MMVMDVPRDPDPLEDDIPDVVVPAAVLADLPITTPEAPPVVQTVEAVQALEAMGAAARNATTDVQDCAKATLRTMDAVMRSVTRLCDNIEHGPSSMTAGVAALIETLGTQHLGLDVHSAHPYAATVQAVSAEGYAVTITVQKANAGELTQALAALMPWLKGAGYVAPESVAGVL